MNKRFLNISKKWLVVAYLLCFSMNTIASANEADDLALAIKQQENLVAKLTELKRQQEQVVQAKQQKELVGTVTAMQVEQKEFKTTLEAIKTQQVEQQEKFKVALDTIQTQLTGKSATLEQQEKLAGTVAGIQQQLQNLMFAIDTIKESQMKKVYEPAVTVGNANAGSGSNTQDAAYAERDAENTFAYAPGGMYKIYCKIGYLTDIRFHPGEKITFVGGGDTAKWIIDTANTGSGEQAVAHLYIKPINDKASTNLIVNTTNHSYQILVNTASWYNPIISWTYSSEEQLAGKIAEQKDDVFFTEKSMSISRPESLNFSYKIKNNEGYNWAPTMVFDDRSKTYIKMPVTIKQGNSPILFIKEKGKKELSLVNYRIKDNFYIVDRLFEQAEIRVSEKESIRIIAKDE